MFLVQPKCAICGRACSHIEILEPHELPHNFEEWTEEGRELFLQYRDPETWQLLFTSTAGAGNGYAGDPMTEEKVNRWKDALKEPLTYERVHTLGLYDDIGFCDECKVPYCDPHWSISTGGVGTCPQGHRKSLDPY